MEKKLVFIINVVLKTKQNTFCELKKKEIKIL